MAVAAAQSGDRAEALRILLELVEEDQNNADAWILLSRLVESPEDRLIAIENALVLLPEDEQLLARRDALLNSHPYLVSGGPQPPMDELEQAGRLAADGLLVQALDILRQYAGQNPGDQRAWQELARLEPGLEKRIAAAEQALRLNPEAAGLRTLLQELRAEQKDPLLRGAHLEAQGEFDRAAEHYFSIVTHSRLPAQRLEAQRRIEQIHLRKESNAAQPVHPTLNLGRLALGPLILFLIMLFLQSGLKPGHISLLALPGILSVAAGGLLVAITEMVPAHPRWVAWFGQPGSDDEPEMRRGLRLLGWALLLAPYTIFLLEAGRRLGELQASMLPGLP